MPADAAHSSDPASHGAVTAAVAPDAAGGGSDPPRQHGAATATATTSAVSGSDLPPFFRYRIDGECYSHFEESVMLRGLELAAYEMVKMDTLRVTHVMGPRGNGDATGPPSIVKVDCGVAGTRADGYTVQIHLLLADNAPAYTAARIKCTCPHGGTRCKHAAALLLFLTSDWTTKAPVPTWKPRPRQPQKRPSPPPAPPRGSESPARQQQQHQQPQGRQPPPPPPQALSLSLCLDSDGEEGDGDSPDADPAALAMFFPKMRPFVSKSPDRCGAAALQNGATTTSPPPEPQAVPPESSPWRHRGDAATGAASPSVSPRHQHPPRVAVESGGAAAAPPPRGPLFGGGAVSPQRVQDAPRASPVRSKAVQRLIDRRAGGRRRRGREEQHQEERDDEAPVEVAETPPPGKRARGGQGAASAPPVTPAGQVMQRRGGGRSGGVAAGYTGGSFTWGSDHTGELEGSAEGVEGGGGGGVAEPSGGREEAQPTTPLDDAEVDTDLTSCFGSHASKARGVSARVSGGGGGAVGGGAAAVAASAPPPRRHSSAAKSLSNLGPIPPPPHTRLAIEKVSFWDMLESSP